MSGHSPRSSERKRSKSRFHADGIDRGDAERIADRAVGRRSASLHQDVLFAAEADQVPDNEEVAGEVELFDQRQFALNLARARVLQIELRRP